MDSRNKETSFEVWRLMNSIHRIWYREAERKLANAGLSIMEYRILRQLSENGPQPMVRLAETNMITQGWVTSLIDRLENRSYVERVRSNMDRRIVNISATDKGKDFYREIMEVHENFIASTLEFMPLQDKENLKTLLHKIEEQLLKTQKVDINDLKPQITE